MSDTSEAIIIIGIAILLLIIDITVKYKVRDKDKLLPSIFLSALYVLPRIALTYNFEIELTGIIVYIAFKVADYAATDLFIKYLVVFGVVEEILIMIIQLLTW